MFSKRLTFIHWTIFILLMCGSSFVHGQNFNQKYIDHTMAVFNDDTQTEENRELEIHKLQNYIYQQPESEQLAIFDSIFLNTENQLELTPLVDAYVKLLVKQRNISKAVDVYLKTAWNYINRSNKKALHVADKALKLSENHHFYTGIVKSLEVKGLYYEIILGDVEKASQFYFEAIEICKKHQLAYIADMFHTVGVLFHTSDNYEKAQSYYEMAYEEAKRQHNTELLKRCYINLGSVHSSLENYPVAESYFLQSLEIPENESYNYDAYANLGNLYLRQQAYQKALPHLERATEMHPNNPDANINLRFLIDAKASLKDTSEMHPILTRAENAITSIPSLRDKSLLLRSISEYYKTTGDYKQAFLYNNAYLTTYEQLIENQKNETLLDLEAKYQSEKIKTSLAKKEKQQTLLLIGGGILVLLTIGFYFFHRKRLHYKNTIQQQKIKELTQKNKLLAMSSIIEGQEAERLRIAQDLHDSLGGLLSSVKAHFTIFKNQFDKEEQLEITQKTYQLIDASCTEVRRISHNMMPQFLNLVGLEGSIEDIAEQLSSLGINVTVDIHNLPESIDATKQITIFRLIQEILSNVRKHANAKNLLIQLIGSENEIQLIIEDDGHGFDYEAALKNKGLGLNNINRRVEFLEGTIQWESVINEGTTITINIPLSP